VTTAPVDGAAPVSVTVAVEDVPPVTVAGLNVREATAGAVGVGGVGVVVVALVAAIVRARLVPGISRYSYRTTTWSPTASAPTVESALFFWTVVKVPTLRMMLVCAWVVIVTVPP